jgi:hypothetical protein
MLLMMRSETLLGGRSCRQRAKPVTRDRATKYGGQD